MWNSFSVKNCARVKKQLEDVARLCSDNKALFLIWKTM